jgi:hypothetical protein
MQQENEQPVITDSDALPNESQTEAPETQQKTSEEPEWLHRRLRSERNKIQREMQAQFDQRLAQLEQKYQPQAQAQSVNQATQGDLNPRNFIRSELQQIAYEEAQKRQAEEEQERVRTFQRQVDNATKKYADFEDVIGNMSLTETMARTAQASPHGAELLYHLAKNQGDELRRIASLSPVQQVREMILAEAKLVPKKVASNAPEPIGSTVATPLAAGGKKTPSQIAREKREQYFARTKRR